MKQILQQAGEKHRCPVLSIKSIRTQLPISAGNGYSPRKTAGKIRIQVWKVAIIWTLQLWNVRCKLQFARRESVNMHAVTPLGIHSPHILSKTDTIFVQYRNFLDIQM